MVKKIIGRFQHYDWGGTSKLPAMFHITNDTQKKYAEYWMGAHPLLPSFLHTDKEKSILDYIQKESTHHIQHLPFLTKILDVEDMLSIQIHPSKQDAERGYAQEEKQHIPLQSFHRTFKDPNEKEEALIAWSEFWMLYGFRKKDDILKHLKQYPFTMPLCEIMQSTDNMSDIFKQYFALDKNILSHIFLEFKKTLNLNSHDKTKHEYWILKAIKQFENAPLDIQKDCMMILFHNIFSLQKDDMIFIKSGSPHAYLEGLGYEIITNSDNVIRSGLTNKKIDKDAFLSITDFSSSSPIYPQRDIKEGIQHIAFPTQSFTLDIIESPFYKNVAFGYEILFVVEGKGKILSSDIELPYKKYDCFFVDAHTPYHINNEENTEVKIYRIYSLK